MDTKVSEHVSPWKLMFRTIPATLAKWVWIVDLLALVAIIVGALSKLFPLWPVVAISSIVWLLLTFAALVYSTNIVFEGLKKENDQLIQNNLNQSLENKQLETKLRNQPDQKELRIARLRHKLAGIFMHKKELKNADDYFALLFLNVVPFLTHEYNLDRIGLFEVTTKPSSNAKTLYCYPFENQKTDLMNELECDIAKYITNANAHLNVSTFALNEHKAFFLQVPVGSIEQKYYLFSFCAKSMDTSEAHNELTELREELEGFIHQVYEYLGLKNEILRLSEYAREMDLHLLSAVLFLDSHNKCFLTSKMSPF